jgi:hypothetical protein
MKNIFTGKDTKEEKKELKKLWEKLKELWQQ